MDGLAILVLALSLLTAMLLMGMIVFGARSRNEMRTIKNELGSSAQELQGSTQDLLRALEESRLQQERIVSRLKNLETIVTSEAWDVIRSAVAPSELPLLLKDVEEEEPTADEKARQIARRIE